MDPAVGLGCRQFAEVCESLPVTPEQPYPWRRIEPTARASDVQGMCSGDWTAGVLVDRLEIPADIKPGEYVLGWRWDCEETAQIWQSCADITIKAASVL